jgi:hypothetical protein
VSATGGCQCGAVRYELTAEPLHVYVCYCRECQKQSASAFGVSVVVPRKALRLTRGAPAVWSRPTDGGRTLDCLFCPACGTRVWHAGRSSATASVKGGSLDHPPDLIAATHIWTSRKLPGVVIPEGAARFAEEPE